MSSKSKKQRPSSTAAISHSKVHDAAAFTTLAYFSPDAAQFALLSLAVDKHRLRIFDASTGSALVEHTIDDARVSSLTWVAIDLTPAQAIDSTKKRKKKTNTSTPAVTPAPKTTTLVSLGLSNGSIALFSTSHNRVLRSLSHPSSLSAVVASCVDTNPAYLWTSSTDGCIRLWDTVRNELTRTFRPDGPGTVPFTALALRPDINSETELLVASHTLRLLCFPVPTSEPSSTSTIPSEKTSFTGHASPITRVQWDNAHPTQFISIAEADRVVNVWNTPNPPLKQGTILANAPLDSPARHAELSSPSSTQTTLLTLSASGKVAIFELPLSTPSPRKPATKSKVATLSPRSIISIPPSKKGDEDVPIVAVAFLPHDPGRICIARLQGGIRPIFESCRYLDDAGTFLPQVSLSKNVSSPLLGSGEADLTSKQKRYVETPSLAVRAGFEPDQEDDLGDIPAKGAGIDGELDVDLAELSLGQRLTALGGNDLNRVSPTSSDNEIDGGLAHTKIPRTRKKEKSRSGKAVPDASSLPVPAHSLSRTLVQALHSGDTRLLETCLLHTDEGVIMSTVRRLPPQMAVPLLMACVERLGRGARAGTGKGGGGGASAQRGMGLLKWIRAVLVVHTGHLMTIPDVVSRLSALHTTLTARLALRDPLLALSGRLELVMSQIELRATGGPTPIVAGMKGKSKAGPREPTKYVEGESESEAEADEMEVENDEEKGSVEDIELGGDSGSGGGSDRESTDEDEDDEDDDENYEGTGLNGFIDDEAEEWSDEDEDVSE